jgi:tetratricopeptide (TPR) repeat protein
MSYLRATALLTRALLARGRVDEGIACLDEARRRAGDGELPRLMVAILTLNAATQIGDTDLALSPNATPPMSTADQPGWSEAGILVGLAALQRGEATDAVATLQASLTRIPKAQSDTFARSTLSLALAAAGRLDEAVEGATAVEGNTRASYHDLLVARLARGFASLRSGQVDDSELAFASAAEGVDATGDRVAQALARLGRARALAASGDARATELLADANDRLAAIGLTGRGWDTAFRLAAGDVMVTKA